MTLVQEWGAGDAYYNETLVFFKNGQGYWMQADRHREEQRIRFQWKTDGSSLTLTTSDGTEHTTRFALVPQNGEHILRFDPSPLPGSYREFY